MCDFLDYNMRYNLRTKNKIAEQTDEDTHIEETQREEKPIEVVNR